MQSGEQALTIYRQIGYRQGEACSLGNLGLAYNSLGQYQKAIASSTCYPPMPITRSSLSPTTTYF
ncbi:tetratricopeptide repeat protein [Planktothrix agardhii]|uniref:tetratricopeptide repeat protein n=1 Tax=Planktothrix agardhii TaxID=1160 RepID=UPI003340BC08